MNFDEIISELRQFAPFFESPQYELAVKEVAAYNGKFKHIIGLGAGRMGYSLRAFIMRLGHMGFNASMIGDTNVPRCGPQTLIIVNSSSGRTPSLVLFASQALSEGASVLLFTSSSAPLIPATHVVCYGEVTSAQVMKTIYEQFTFLMLDKLAADVQQATGVGTNFMEHNHSVLE